MRMACISLFAVLFVAATLYACANPGIVQTSPDEYLLARSDKAGIFGDASAMKTEVLREANEFAKSRGKVLMPISIDEVPLAAGRFAKIEYRFRLLNPAPTISNSKGTNASIPKTESGAIDYYFSDHELEPIEGIWTWDDNLYQVAIVRNDTMIEDQYDFVGVIIRADSSSWKSGDVKLLLNATASPTVFTGIYFDSAKLRRNLSYILEDPNLLKVNKSIGDRQPLLIRDYPSGLSRDPVTADGRVSQGTCFVAGPKGMVITSYHVIDGAKSISVILADGREMSAVVEKSSAANDIAVMRVDATTPDYLSFTSTRSNRIGDQVFTIGFPTKNLLGSEAKFTEGSISALSGVQGEASYMQISVPIQPGNSGGPVVNYAGNVVGVIAASAAIQTFYKVTGSLPQNVNWAVKSDYIRPMIDEVVDRPNTSSRMEAISRVQRAICQVTASR